MQFCFVSFIFRDFSASFAFFCVIEIADVFGPIVVNQQSGNRLHPSVRGVMNHKTFIYIYPIIQWCPF